MTCPRCGGLVVPDHPCQFSASAECLSIDDEAMDAWKCVNCGNVEDATILKNRARQSGAQKVLSDAA